MFTGLFWKATGERAVKTAAQTLLALWLVGDNGFFNALDIDWTGALSVGLGATILSVLTSLASGAAGPAGPSLGPERLTIGGKHARPDGL